MAKFVEESVEETLSYMDFPTEHWRNIRTNNGLERIMKEIRRRTRVVGSFPDGYCHNACRGKITPYFHNKMGNAPISCLQNLRNGCIIRKWHNFYNQSKRNVRKIPDTTDGKLWKDLIRAYNHEVFGHRTFIDGIPEDLPIPDYTKLKYER